MQTNETTEKTNGEGVWNQTPEDQHRVDEMLSEGGGVVNPAVTSADAEDDPFPAARSEIAPPSKRFWRWLEDVSQKWGKERLKMLVERKGRLSHTMGSVPQNMHRVASQTQLVLELLDDFRDGTYRQISWRSVALLVGAVLYAVSPADVIPDALPLVGQMDDLAVLAVITRLLQKDLRDYCRFKGYPEEEYFRA